MRKRVVSNSFLDQIRKNIVRPKEKRAIIFLRKKESLIQIIKRMILTGSQTASVIAAPCSLHSPRCQLFETKIFCQFLISQTFGIWIFHYLDSCGILKGYSQRSQRGQPHHEVAHLCKYLNSFDRIASVCKYLIGQRKW